MFFDGGTLVKAGYEGKAWHLGNSGLPYAHNNTP